MALFQYSNQNRNKTITDTETSSSSWLPWLPSSSSQSSLSISSPSPLPPPQKSRLRPSSQHARRRASLTSATPRCRRGLSRTETLFRSSSEPSTYPAMASLRRVLWWRRSWTRRPGTRTGAGRRGSALRSWEIQRTGRICRPTRSRSGRLRMHARGSARH